MLLLANKEAWPGFPTTVQMLREGAISLDAMVAGISKVESEVQVRSVGYGGWPNMLGNMELDGAVMDGNTRDVGTVGAVVVRDVYCVGSSVNGIPGVSFNYYFVFICI